MHSRPFFLVILSVGSAAAAAVWTHRPAAAPGPAAPPTTVASDATQLLAAIAPGAGPDVTCLLSLLRANPGKSDGWVKLGDALMQHSRETADAGRYRLIERVYLQAHTLDATNADALLGLAWAAGACHRFEDSVAWATLALQSDPELAAAYGILGDAAVELGRYEEAADHYQKMLDLRPDLGSYSRAAHLLYLRGNVTRAMALMRQAIRAGGTKPEHTAWCVAELGLMLCREGAAPAAVRLLDDALRATPGNLALLNAAGHARMAAGDDDGARAALEQSVALRPQHVSLAALYRLHLAAGRAAQAADVARQIEQLHATLRDQGVRGGEGQLAMFLAESGQRLDEAIRLAEYEHSHHRGPVSADVLAWAYHRAGRNREAAAQLPAILRHRVPDPAMLYRAAVIEEAVGRTADAKRHFFAAVSREPRFDPVAAPLAYAALDRLGDVAPAVARVATGTRHAGIAQH